MCAIRYLERVNSGDLRDGINDDASSFISVLQMFIDNGRIPLFDTAFNYINFHVYDGLREIEAVKFLSATGFEATNFTLTLNVINQAGALLLRLNFDPERFSAVQIEHITEYYCAALRLIAADSNASHNSQTILPEEEREQVLYEWNETKAEFPSGKCVHELFEEQVRRSPEATAVVFEEEELSYGELNARANRLAHYLRELGVKPDARVAICVERGFEMIVGMLAILKAGGGYVPLDPAYPDERLQYMLEDSAPVVLLTQRHLQDRFSGSGGGVPVLDLNATAAWQSSRRATRSILASGSPQSIWPMSSIPQAPPVALRASLSNIEML